MHEFVTSGILVVLLTYDKNRCNVLWDEQWIGISTTLGNCDRERVGGNKWMNITDVIIIEKQPMKLQEKHITG